MAVPNTQQPRSCLLGGAVLLAFSAVAGHAYEAAMHAGDVRVISDIVGCGTKPIGQIIVATLNHAPMVSLSANGHAISLILDTGAERTILTPAVADRIGAQRPRVEFQRQMRGIAGTLPTHEVELRSFAAGNIAMPWRRVLVAPVTLTKVFPTPLDGLLGADALSDFDIDLDLPHHQMIFYQKQSCPTAAPDWGHPYAVVSTGRSRGERLFFPVQLDGHRIIAVIDSGSQLTTLSMTAARMLGLSEGSLSRDRPVMTQGAAAELLTSRVHRFAKLEIGPMVIQDPEVIVTDLKLGDADLILGIDFLSSRRIWLSYGSRRIFLSTK